MMAGTLGRALIVEDDPSWQQILTEILTDMNLAVDVADSLDTARACLRAVPHRLAVVDLSLGGTDHHNQDGLNVLDTIRRQDPGCVSILLTGFATVELAVSALREYGASTCLRKETFRRADFRRFVQEALAVAPLPTAAAATQPAAGSGHGDVSVTKRQSRVQVLVVEDDAGWRSILSELLSDMGCQVKLSASYGEALGRLRKQRFDLAIVDLSLASSVQPTPNLDGYRVLANTRAAAIPTVVVSGTAAPHEIERAYAEFDILMCLEKQAFDRQLFRRVVEEALAGQTRQADGLAGLTHREREVLKLVARGMTNKQIAEVLVVSPNTVKRHLKAVFAKLGVSTRAAATAKAIDAQGLVDG